MDRKKRILSLLVMLAITLACVPALPTVAPLSTRPAGAVETMVAGTAAAAAKSTERASSPTPRPNATLVPTHTPGPALSPTATIIFKIPTIVISGGGGTGGSGGSGGGNGGGSSGPPPEMACKVVGVTPFPGGHVKADKDFKTTWRVRNQGSAGWDENSVDYQYVLGAKMHKQPIYDLPYSVPPGNLIYLVVAMHSPSRPGAYTATWALHASATFFCKLEMKIIVD